MSKRDSKKGIDINESRRRREQQTISIRKEKKEENLSKRRNLASLSQETETEAIDIDSIKSSYTVSDIPNLFIGLQCNDIQTQLTSIRGFRKLLSVSQNAPIQECIDISAIPYFVNCLQRMDSPSIQYEAAWALTNIASTNFTSIVVESGAIPHLVQLLTSNSPEIREQVAWCLGNIAGDSSLFRDVVLNNGALTPLIYNLQQPENVSLLRNCTWTLSNFCRGKPQPPLSAIINAFPILGSLCNPQVDLEACVDATWALSYISDGDNNRIQAVIDMNVLSNLLVLLNSDKNNLIIPALRTVGNLVSGDDHQTQAVIDAGLLNVMNKLLTHTKKNIRKEALWLLSNIAAGTPHQLATLMNIPNLITYVIQQLSTNVEWEPRKEAVWVICNILTSGNESHIIQLVEHGVLGQLCELLGISDVKILLIVLDGIDSILNLGTIKEKLGIFELFDEAGGIEKIEQLQEHENNEIYKKCVSLIEKYFNDEDDEQSENLVPNNANNTFSFGFQNNTSKLPVTQGLQQAFSF